ncbi:unnamed protein product [Bodo saltans]|uniref:Uncharacterized protein n=1 Tax=Bodo saltans TaxID=75058 RepID=A0A0S4IR07_BODSA|nr:unnamed protein product [Bodo saltans]|eukprot:CUF99740.1 unnamed protein product [Bodo saltans]
MLSRSLVRLSRSNGKNRFPSVVSYNRLPWEQLAAHSNQVHAAVSPHYDQILSLASQRKLPQLVKEEHIQIPELHQLRLLPGTVYIMKHSEGGHAQPIPNWEKKLVTDSHATQYYGSVGLLHHLNVAEIATFVSPDLRIYCNAVTVTPSGRQAASDAPLKSSSIGEIGVDGGFTIFQYYRPNRPAAEIVKPLMAFYRHVPTLSVVNDFAGKSWTPRLDAPVRSPTAKVTPNKPFVPPQSYLYGLAERRAVIPGDSYGRRSLMWGNWF